MSLYLIGFEVFKEFLYVIPFFSFETNIVFKQVFILTDLRNEYVRMNLFSPVLLEFCNRMCRPVVWVTSLSI